MSSAAVIAWALVLCRLAAACPARAGSKVASWISSVAPAPAADSAGLGRVSPGRGEQHRSDTNSETSSETSVRGGGGYTGFTGQQHNMQGGRSFAALKPEQKETHSHPAQDHAQTLTRVHQLPATPVLQDQATGTRAVIHPHGAPAGEPSLRHDTQHEGLGVTTAAAGGGGGRRGGGRGATSSPSNSCCCCWCWWW
jgi:hypothetical protein